MTEEKIIDQHPEGHHSASEKVVEKVVEQLDIELPKTKLPLPVKIIAFLMVIGGLSVVGTLLVDLLTLGTDLRVRLARVVLAVLIAAIGYGIMRRQRLALWLLVLVMIGGVLLNPFSIVVLAPLIIYLFWNKKYLHPSVIDRFFGHGKA